MRIERVIEEIAKELAKRDRCDWDQLDEDEREVYRIDARGMTEEIVKRLGDRGRKYEE